MLFLILIFKLNLLTSFNFSQFKSGSIAQFPKVEWVKYAIIDSIRSLDIFSPDYSDTFAQSREKFLDNFADFDFPGLFDNETEADDGSSITSDYDDDVEEFAEIDYEDLYDRVSLFFSLFDKHVNQEKGPYCSSAKYVLDVIPSYVKDQSEFSLSIINQEDNYFTRSYIR